MTTIDLARVRNIAAMMDQYAETATDDTATAIRNQVLAIGERIETDCMVAEVNGAAVHLIRKEQST